MRAHPSVVRRLGGWGRGGRLGQVEVIFLVLASYGGLGLFAFPAEAVTHAREGWWLSVPLALGASGLGAWALTRLARAHAGEPSLGVVAHLGGRILPWLLGYALAGLDLGLAGAAVAALGQVLVESVLPHTPYPLLVGLVCLTVAYTAAQGIEGMARAVNVVVGATFALFLVAGFLVLPQLHYPGALVARPVSPLSQVLSGALSALYAVSGTSLLYHLGGHVRQRDRGWLERAVMTGFGLVVGERLLQAVLVVGALGLTGIHAYTWPMVALLRLSGTLGFLLNRLGVLALVAATAAVWSYAGVRLWSASAFTLRGRHPRRGGDPLRVFALTLLLFGLCLALRQPWSVEAWVGDVLNPSLAVLGVAVPVGLWGVDHALRRRKGRRPQPAAGGEGTAGGAVP